MSALTDMIAAVNNCTDAYHSLVPELRDAVPQITRIFDDANPTVAAPAGTAWNDSTLTHSGTYVSKFPGRASKIFFLWTSSLQITGPEDSNPIAQLCLTSLNAGKLLTNVEAIGLRGSTGNDRLSGAVCANGLMERGADEDDVVFEQRIYMSYGTTSGAATARLDKLELLILEVADNG